MAVSGPLNATVATSQRRLRASEADVVRSELLDLAGSWRRVTADDPWHPRPIVSSLLVGRVSFTPAEEPKPWMVKGEGMVAELFTSAVVPVGVASPVSASWNRLRGWLRGMDGLRKAA